ncbi:MAG: hypothetical protein R3Y05_01720 [bacterium]
MVKGAKIYTIVTQCFIQMFVLMFLGYKIGADWLIKDANWGAILCVLGAIIGLINLVVTIMKAGDIFDKRKDIQ